MMQTYFAFFLSVLLRLTDSDYTLGIFKLFLSVQFKKNVPLSKIITSVKSKNKIDISSEAVLNLEDS